MPAFFTLLSHCYVLFCCEIQSLYPGFTPRLPVCSRTALRMANGNPRKTYNHRHPRETAKKEARGTDRVARVIDIGWEHEMLAECAMWNRDTVHNQICLPFTFLLFVSPTPPVRSEIESILNWIFRLPFPPNRMQSDNSSFSHTHEISSLKCFAKWLRSLLRKLFELFQKYEMSWPSQLGSVLCVSAWAGKWEEWGIRRSSREKIPAQGAFAIGFQNGAFRSPSSQQAS